MPHFMYMFLYIIYNIYVVHDDGECKTFMLYKIIYDCDFTRFLRFNICTIYNVKDLFILYCFMNGFMFVSVKRA